MDKFIGRWSLSYTAAFLTLMLTGTIVFWSVAHCGEKARLLTIKEQQFIICGDNVHNPGACDYPPAGGECNMANSNCSGQNSYCQRVQQEGLTCELEILYQNPLRCLSGSNPRLSCFEDTTQPVTCYYTFKCQCYYDGVNKVWACGDVYDAGEVDRGKCANVTNGG